MSRPPRESAEAVVITGIGVLCSIATDLDSFAFALKQGRSGIEMSCDNGESAARISAEIRGFDFSEAISARRSLPESLRQRAQRLAFRSPFPIQAAVITALEAWESARLHDEPVPSDRLSLVVGGNNLTGRYSEGLYPRFLKNPAHLQARFALHFQDTDHVGTLSHVLGITGEGYTAGGASASGNVAIINGSRLVELGVADACLVVGALADLSSMERQSFFNLGVMAGKVYSDQPKAACRPFDEAHEGFVYGQGSACLILESETSARRRGATIFAELGGYDLKLDGNSLADPQEQGQARVMSNAIGRAGLEPKHISYVNTHGTASPLGDQTEIKAMHRTFGQFFGQPWINATKGLTGHCLYAAGVIEAVATIAQMRGRFVHPNANLVNPIDGDCRFVGPRAEAAEIEFALSNSFGFGGFNSSILLINRKNY